MNTRTYIVGRAEAGRTVADWLRDRLALPPGEVRRLLRERRVYLGGAPCLDAARRLQRGQRLEVRGPSVSKKIPSGANASGSPAAKPVLVYADEHVVVADKPPGLTTMRHAEDVAEFGARRGASCRRPWPICCPDYCRKIAGAGRPPSRRPPPRQRDQRPRRLRAPPRRRNAISDASSARTPPTGFISPWSAAGRSRAGSNRCWCATAATAGAAARPTPSPTVSGP